MLELVFDYYKGRKFFRKVWFILLCFSYFLGVRLFGYTQFNYMSGNFLGNLHRKYFADIDYTEGSVGISGMILEVVRILLAVIFHEVLFIYGFKLLDDPYTFKAWIISIGVSYLLTPIIIAMFVKIICKLFKLKPETSFFGNSISRFLKGAYIPIPYTIIWIFGR